MKKCLQCEQVYGDETNFCLSDGSTLVPFSGSFASNDETPTVYGGSPAPTVYSGSSPAPPTQNNASFTQPISYTPPEPKKSNTVLIALTVGLLALLVGGAVVGLAMYGLFYSDNKNPNVANISNSADKSNKTAQTEQKTDNDNTAENLKQQQEKLDKEKQKLEAERKRLEAQKKEATPPPTSSSATTAAIIDPPSNIRAAPNGTIICVVRQRGTIINILGSTGVSDNNGTWYYTDACGRQGVIHSSQIKF